MKSLFSVANAVKDAGNMMGDKVKAVGRKMKEALPERAQLAVPLMGKAVGMMAKGLSRGGAYALVTQLPDILTASQRVRRDPIEALKINEAKEAVYDPNWLVYGRLADIAYNKERAVVEKKLAAELPGAEILLHQGKACALTRSFYLAVTRDATSGTTVFFVIRGSKETDDWLTNLTTDATRVGDAGAGHKAHEGMLKAADLLLKDPGVVDGLTKTLTRNAKNPEPRRLIVVGHSLGGGVAALLAYRLSSMPLLHPDGKRDVELACYTFGCPPCTSVGLAAQLRPTITAIVNGFDVVPHMDEATSKKVKRTESLVQYFRKKRAAKERERKAAEGGSDSAGGATDAKKEKGFRVPGRVLYLKPDESSLPVDVTETFRPFLHVCSRMVADHLMKAYLPRIQAAVPEAAGGQAALSN